MYISMDNDKDFDHWIKLATVSLTCFIESVEYTLFIHTMQPARLPCTVTEHAMCRGFNSDLNQPLPQANCTVQALPAV